MIEVVAGIIYKNNKFLIAQRNLKKSQGGLWEFPGGKVEKNESYESEYIGESVHHYPEKDIKLIFYKARLLSKNIELLEHESCEWITKDEKDKFEFAGADRVVFDLI